MRAFYQTEWQNIPFSSFTNVSSKSLADSEFYDAFYCALFQKYSGYEELEENWRRNKDEIAFWLAASLPDGARVLSVGCGLGYIEQRLWLEQAGRIDLHVQDYSSQALKWLRQIMPADHIHDVKSGGQVCRTHRRSYDLIYLSAVDYALPDEALLELFADMKHCLSEEGQLLIISASFLDDTSGWRKLIEFSKEKLKLLLEKFGLYRRGQFWGWMRTREDYREAMSVAGFAHITDGFIKTKNQRTYWIKGVKK